MAVLRSADLEFWEENGYVVVPRAVPRQNLDAVVRALCEFQGADLDDPESWYREQPHNEMEELNYSGMVELYHHPAMWENRQFPRVHQAFSEILGTERLWVTIDRLNLSPPVRPGWEFHGFIHWDVDTSLRPIPFQVQGVLSLTDTPVERGGFQCVAGFHRRFEEWVKTQPADRDPWRPDLAGLKVEPIPTQAGDLLIWHSLLPHGTRPNRSDRPRLAQYISMFPAQERDAQLREWRIRAWRERLHPEGFAFPEHPQERDQHGGPPAPLSELGEKLLGLRRWDDRAA